jgi:hypothetical protein
LVRHLKRLAGPAWLALVATIAGCGGGESDGLPRQAVWGKVSLDGQPLAHGRIEFHPASPEAKVSAAGAIQDGAYSIPRDQGPTPGDYRVMISSAGTKPGADAAPGAEDVKAPPAAPELVPKQYNSKTTLTAKVEADNSKSFDFDLKR